MPSEVLDDFTAGLAIIAGWVEGLRTRTPSSDRGAFDLRGGLETYQPVGESPCRQLALKDLG